MEFVLDQRELILEGFWRTVQLAVASGVLSLVFGSVLGVMRVCPIPPLRWAGTAYVTIVRNTPLTLVFVFSVFGLPRLDIRFSFFVFAVIALTVYTSAFVCEALRSGINAVPDGEIEAARSIGLPFRHVLGLVVLPQAFRAVIPLLSNIFIALINPQQLDPLFQRLIGQIFFVAAIVMVLAGFLIIRMVQYREPLRAKPWSEVAIAGRVFYIPVTVIGMGRRLLRQRAERF